LRLAILRLAVLGRLAVLLLAVPGLLLLAVLGRLAVLRLLLAGLRRPGLARARLRLRRPAVRIRLGPAWPA